MKRKAKKAHAFSATLVGESLDDMGVQLTNYNAFKEPEKGKLSYKH